MMCWILNLFKRKNKKPKNQSHQADSVEIVTKNIDQCSNCGAKLDDGANVQICPYCGNDL